MKGPLSIGIGFSETGDAEKAAKDAQEMAGTKVGFAILFSSSRYDPNKVYEDTSSVFTDANIIGCTTAGEICSLAKNATSDSVAVLGVGGARIRTAVGVGTG
ncbi:MAG: hypothetical protein HXS49_12775, partial [Theionarchaea archaeon]|nr:hypothetical protein [Theionarchaea archaeon]